MWRRWCRCEAAERCRCGRGRCLQNIPSSKVATDTKILDLRTRYRTKLGWFFWFCLMRRYHTIQGKWQIVYLRTRYRTKVGRFFWFGTIHETICRNLGKFQPENLALKRSFRGSSWRRRHPPPPPRALLSRTIRSAMELVPSHLPREECRSHPKSISRTCAPRQTNPNTTRTLRPTTAPQRRSRGAASSLQLEKASPSAPPPLSLPWALSLLPRPPAPRPSVPRPGEILRLRPCDRNQRGSTPRRAVSDSTVGGRSRNARLGIPSRKRTLLPSRPFTLASRLLLAL